MRIIGAYEQYFNDRCKKEKQNRDQIYFSITVCQLVGQVYWYNILKTN